MSEILEFKTTKPDIGISVRTQTEGPEAALLDEFLEQYASKLNSLKRHYAFFYEPLLPTGYPDLVVVTYNPKTYESWTNERMTLGVLELKVLHHLHFVKGSTSTDMEQQLGFDSKLLLRILEKLMDASLLRRAKQRWLPKQLKTSYGISNIKTIEAKISNWPNVFSQANMNRWFASESCILSPVSKPSEQVIAQAREKGIGIYSLPSGVRVKTIQRPVRASGAPVSYASWMFNEWIGRQLFKRQGIV